MRPECLSPPAVSQCLSLKISDCLWLFLMSQTICGCFCLWMYLTICDLSLNVSNCLWMSQTMSLVFDVLWLKICDDDAPLYMLLKSVCLLISESFWLPLNASVTYHLWISLIISDYLNMFLSLIIGNDWHWWEKFTMKTCRQTPRRQNKTYSTVSRLAGNKMFLTSAPSSHQGRRCWCISFIHHQ